MHRAKEVCGKHEGALQNRHYKQILEFALAQGFRHGLNSSGNLRFAIKNPYLTRLIHHLIRLMPTCWADLAEALPSVEEKPLTC
jgi:hypothetical protein